MVERLCARDKKKRQRSGDCRLSVCEGASFFWVSKQCDSNLHAHARKCGKIRKWCDMSHKNHLVPKLVVRCVRLLLRIVGSRGCSAKA